MSSWRHCSPNGWAVGGSGPSSACTGLTPEKNCQKTVLSTDESKIKRDRGRPTIFSVFIYNCVDTEWDREENILFLIGRSRPARMPFGSLAPRPFCMQEVSASTFLEHVTVELDNKMLSPLRDRTRSHFSPYLRNYHYCVLDRSFYLATI
jgi:hypothetical protein